VVAAGSSSSIPVSGSAGRKNIGQIELASMEPMPDKTAVSPLFSFTDTRYTDKSTNTNQMRTLAIVRTSDKSGYYIDIYRSDNSQSNDYVYHNIGDNLSFLNASRQPVNTVPVKEYPQYGKDFPGFRFFKDVKKLSGWSQNLIALFSAKDGNSEDIYMQLLLPAKAGREYYQAMSMKTKTSGRQYSGRDLPVFTMRDKSESLNKPFITVFEPFKGKDNYTVDHVSVEQRHDGKDFTVLTVFNRDKSKQLILQSIDETKIYTLGKSIFSGYVGIVSIKGASINSLYLGEGNLITYGGYTLKTNVKGSASLEIKDNELIVSCNQTTVIGIPVKKEKKIILHDGANVTSFEVTGNKGVAFITVPVLQNGIIKLE
jgi:hypothetical protein